jgi:hypothetical protein
MTKWLYAFKDPMGHPDVKIGITGQEKVDFITRSKVHFNPSLRESYGIAFMECLGHTHCIVLDNQDWSDNFDQILFSKCKQADVPAKIIELYNKPYDTAGLVYVMLLDEQVEQHWKNLLENFKAKQSKSSSAKILKYDTVCYKEFIIELNRDNLAREDFESVLSNKHKFNVIYTDANTYLSKDSAFVPEDETVNLFEF